MKKLLVLLPFLLLISVYSYDVVCINGTTNASVTCNTPNGWTLQHNFYRTFYPTQQYNYTFTIENLYPSNSVFNSYTMNGSRSYSSGVTWNCTNSATLSGDIYYRCMPSALICGLKIKVNSNNMAINIRTYVYRYDNYSFIGSSTTGYSQTTNASAFYLNQPYTYFSLFGGSCDSYQNSMTTKYQVKPNAENQPIVDGNIMLAVSANPFISIINPLNNSVQYQNFTVNVSIGNLAMCFSPVVESEVYDNEGVTIDYQYNTSVTDGYFVYDVESGYFGKPFFISSVLYCGGSLEDFDFNEFSISLQNTTSNAVNGSILKNIYSPLCFYTPMPEAVCNVPIQDIYIYVNGLLYYNLNATNETSFCFRDRGLDGYVPVRVVSYCSDTKSLIDDKTLWFNFLYQFKHLGQDFGGFLSGVMPSYTSFIIMFIIVGFIVMVFGAIFSSGVSVWK